MYKGCFDFIFYGKNIGSFNFLNVSLKIYWKCICFSYYFYRISCFILKLSNIFFYIYKKRFSVFYDLRHVRPENSLRCSIVFKMNLYVSDVILIYTLNTMVI